MSIILSTLIQTNARVIIRLSSSCLKRLGQGWPREEKGSLEQEAPSQKKQEDIWWGGRLPYSHTAPTMKHYWYRDNRVIRFLCFPRRGCIHRLGKGPASEMGNTSWRNVLLLAILCIELPPPTHSLSTHIYIHNNPPTPCLVTNTSLYINELIYTIKIPGICTHVAMIRMNRKQTFLWTAVGNLDIFYITLRLYLAVKPPILLFVSIDRLDFVFTAINMEELFQIDFH